MPIDTMMLHVAGWATVGSILAALVTLWHRDAVMRLRHWVVDIRLQQLEADALTQASGSRRPRIGAIVTRLMSDYYRTKNWSSTDPKRSLERLTALREVEALSEQDRPLAIRDVAEIVSLLAQYVRPTATAQGGATVSPHSILAAAVGQNDLSCSSIDEFLDTTAISQSQLFALLCASALALRVHAVAESES